MQTNHLVVPGPAVQAEARLSTSRNHVTSGELLSRANELLSRERVLGFWQPGVLWTIFHCFVDISGRLLFASLLDKLKTEPTVFNIRYMYSYILHLIQFYCCCFFQKGHLGRTLSDVETLALIVGCLCHDLDHRGTNNQFQIK